jgi:outer membrane protein assembly factor BamA
VVRLLAIACVVLAGAPRARAQVAEPVPRPPASTPDPAAPPVAPPPETSRAIPPPEPPPPAAPVPPRKPSDAARIDRLRAEEQCAARDPGCDWVATLSSLERASVVRALAQRGYVVDPAPWNKVIGKIQVYNEEVFAEGGRFLQFFNNFHVTTKESTIRAEAVIAPGEVWSQDRIEETARRLRDPLWTSVVAVLPVQAATPGSIDVLIVTRDIWSLRLNTSYTYQQGKLTNLITSFSENNLLGRRDVLSAALSMDQGAIALGPVFIDKNLMGERLDLRAQVSDILTRDELTEHGKLSSEGTQSTITLTRPLWSLATEWAGGASFSHRFAIDRQFKGTGLRTFDYIDPVEMTTTSFGRQYRMRRWTTQVYVTRQWGTELKHQLSFGHSVTSQRPRPLDDFTGDAAQRAAFIANVLPRSEVTSVPFIQYAVFTPRYRTLRNIATFDLAEDARIGPDFEASLGFGLAVLGSDHNFQRLASSAGWTFPWSRDGFVRVSGGLGGRYQDGELIDNTATGAVRTATPPIAGRVRFHAQASLSTRWNDTQNQFFAIGSDTGLRGYGINAFSGQRLFSFQIEARTLPYPIWVLRLGGVVFYDLGGAADLLAELPLHQDAGLGLRMLIPQTSAQLLKFDFAVPFDGIRRGQLQFLAGFGSEF